MYNNRDDVMILTISEAYMNPEDILLFSDFGSHTKAIAVKVNIYGKQLSGM